jgi:uncharacterized membrane protein (UPF0127 family)
MAEYTHVKLINDTTEKILIESARWCSSTLCRLRGLQFRTGLAPGEAIVLANPREGITASSIHMFFVFFPIAAVWINDKGRVTSAQLAKPWRPYYASPEPARYVLETDPGFLERISVGDRVKFIPRLR